MISSAGSIGDLKSRWPEAGEGRDRKVAHLHFYYHDSLNVPDPVSLLVASAPSSNKSSTFYGQVFMADAPLTEGVQPESKLVGRAQGFYAMASKEEIGLLWDFTYLFLEGEYNGSTFSVQGKNAILHPVREMPVIGGSGVFRLTRGYVKVKTILYNSTTGVAIIEHDVYLVHD